MAQYVSSISHGRACKWFSIEPYACFRFRLRMPSAGSFIRIIADTYTDSTQRLRMASGGGGTRFLNEQHTYSTKWLRVTSRGASTRFVDEPYTDSTQRLRMAKREPSHVSLLNDVATPETDQEWPRQEPHCGPLPNNVLT